LLKGEVTTEIHYIIIVPDCDPVFSSEIQLTNDQKIMTARLKPQRSVPNQGIYCTHYFVLDALLGCAAPRDNVIVQTRVY